MDILIRELKQFSVNVYNLRHLLLLVPIIIFIALPLYFYSYLCDYCCSSFSNAFFMLRLTWFYIILLSTLITSYNHICTPEPGLGLGLGLGPVMNFQFEPFMLFGINQIHEGRGAGAGAGAVAGGAEDQQNVHDSLVQAHIIETVNKLKLTTATSTSKLNISETLTQIRNYILNGYKGSDEVREKALISLKKINRLRGIIVNLNMNEMEILRLVWNRINDQINSKNLETLKDNIVVQLADITYDADDKIYCVQGRVSRLLQSLEMADAENIINLKPMWVIKDGISSFFAKYRDNYIKQLSKKAQYLCNEALNLSVKDQQFVNRVNKKIADGIRKRLIIRYVNSKLLTQQQFNDLTEPYFNELGEP